MNIRLLLVFTLLTVSSLATAGARCSCQCVSERGKKKTLAQQQILLTLQQRLDEFDVEKNRENKDYCTFLSQLHQKEAPLFILEYHPKTKAWRVATPHANKGLQAWGPNPRDAAQQALHNIRVCYEKSWTQMYAPHLRAIDSSILKHTSAEELSKNWPQGPKTVRYRTPYNGKPLPIILGEVSIDQLPITEQIALLKKLAAAKQALLEDLCTHLYRAAAHSKSIGKANPFSEELMRGCDEFYRRLQSF